MRYSLGFLMMMLALGCTFQGECVEGTCQIVIKGGDDVAGNPTPTREVGYTPEPTTTPSSTPFVVQTVAATATLNHQEVCNVTNSPYRMRATPSLSGQFVGWLYSGRCVEAANPAIILEGDGYRWAQILPDGVPAWVVADAVGL